MAQLVGGYHDSTDRRDLPIQSAASGADGSTNFGGEVASASTATTLIPVRPEGTWQADGPSTGLVSHAFHSGLETWIGQERLPRSLAAMDGDGQADLVAFGDEGGRVALAHADGDFGTPGLVNEAFGYDSGWTTQDQSPCMMADVNGDDRADLVGFRPQGVWGDIFLWLG
jgi:hypothetical protein